MWSVNGQKTDFETVRDLSHCATSLVTPKESARSNPRDPTHEILDSLCSLSDFVICSCMLYFGATFLIGSLDTRFRAERKLDYYLHTATDDWPNQLALSALRYLKLL